MTSTDTPTICNCGRDIIWSAPGPGDGHGYWKHTGATESGFLFCYSVTGANRLDPDRQRATPAPGHEHIGPGGTEPTPGEGFSPARPGISLADIPAAADVDADPVLYTQARAVELLSQARSALAKGSPDVMRELGPEWVGGVLAIMEGLLTDAGVRDL